MEMLEGRCPVTATFNWTGEVTVAPLAGALTTTFAHAFEHHTTAKTLINFGNDKMRKTRFLSVF